MTTCYKLHDFNVLLKPVYARDQLERLCRYVSRPPIALERLSIDGDGLVVYALKRPFSDGTTHVLFEPLDFIARLAALVPRPRVHLVRYHGLFAPNARQRPEAHRTNELDATAASGVRHRPQSTSALWRASTGQCSRLTEPKTIAAILEHLNARQARAGTARAPPQSALH